MDELTAAAAELLERIDALNTMTALPGDTAMRWHDHREECITLANTIHAKLMFMAVPA